MTNEEFKSGNQDDVTPSAKETQDPKNSPLIKENSSLIKNINLHFEKPFEIVSKLQLMKTLEQPLLYPKIVVVGDSNTYVLSVVNQLIGTQIPGHSSLLVPLIIKLEKDTSDDSKSYYIMRYDTADNQHVETKFTENLSEKLREAARTMVNQRDFFKTPITLCIYQNYISNLTIVIPTRVHTNNDTKLEERERKNLKEFLMTDHCQGECVFLNVTSAAKDLNLHQSSEVLAEFDHTGKRTVSVVTYDDKCSENSLLRFTSIIHTKKPMGYVLLILKGGVDTHIKEGNPLYEYVKAGCYGYESLSNSVVKVMLASTLGPILKRVTADIESCSQAKKNLTKKFETIGDAWETFLSVVDSSQRSLDKLMIGNIYREHREDVKMHISNRLMEQFSVLQKNFLSKRINTSGTFLEDEFRMLEDGLWSLPSNIMSSDAFPALLEKQLNFVIESLNKFLENLWGIIEWTVKQVVFDHAKAHSELRGDLEQYVEHAIEIARSSFNTKVQDIIALEKSIPFIVFVTDFNDSWNKLKSLKSVIGDLKDQDWVKIEVKINVGLSKKAYPKEWSNDTWKHAFDLKMYVTAYWDVLSQRLINQFAINLLSTLKDFVNGGMRSTMTNYLSETEKDTKLLGEEPEILLDRVNSAKREENLGDLKREIQGCLAGLEFLLRERGQKERVKVVKESG